MKRYLDKKDVPAEWLHLFGYNGAKYAVEVHENGEMAINDNDLRWSGGSRKSYVVLVDSKRLPISDVKEWPDVGSQRYRLHNMVIAEHCIFCGKDLGLVFHISPDSVNPLRIEQDVELTDMQKAVLWVTCSRKSSYNGMNRFDMLNEARRWRNEKPLRQVDYDSAVEELKSLGMIDNRKAATNKGRNAYQSFHNLYM